MRRISYRLTLATSLVSLAAMLSVPAPAAQRSTELSLDALFSHHEFDSERFGPAHWLNDGTYTTIEASTTIAGAQDIVRYDAASGERSVMVGAERLVPEFHDGEPIDIETYQFSPDGRLLLVFTNSERVWRTNTRGDYWLLSLDSGELRRIGGSGRDSVLMFAKFSPDSTRIAFVRDNDLFMEDLRTQVVTRLTHEGSDTIANGTFDWVYEEELSLRDGFRWSPDGRRIAFWQIDSSLVRQYVLVNTTEQLYPVLTRFPYPKAGEVNPAARVGVIPAGGGEITWMDLPGSRRDNYIARMDWAASPWELVIQYLNRRQSVNRVYLADVRTGTARVVLQENDDAWVDIRDDLHFLDRGRAFTWVSERDGWRRIYRVSRDGSSIVPLTPERTDILSLDRVDEESGWLYFSATPDPTERFLYRVPLNPQAGADTANGHRGAEAERLSPQLGGTHTYRLSPHGSFAFHTASNFDTPSQVDLVSLPEHGVVRTLVANKPLRDRVAELGLPAVEFFRVEVEPGVDLDAWAIFPPDFDPERTYPVLFYVYGEPWSLTVLDRWGGRRALWHRYLAQQGYVVMSVDNRGTPAPRGRDWRKMVYGEIGTLAAQDQANAVRAILASRPYLDPERVGIWGWSGGGSMTLNALFRYPEIYRTGMSVAPVPDQRYYDTIYQERYMGTPQDNPEGYRRGSPIQYAHRLRGDLLVVHGTGDDNVHYQGTEALINRLIELGKPFTMMAYPNRTHAISEGPGTTRHLYGLLTRYLLEHLPPGPGSSATPSP